MEKIVGWLGCSTQFSLVTQKAQVQEAGTQEKGGLWA